MNFFGKPHIAPVYLEDACIPTPVGSPCGWCQESIEDGDDGFVMPHLEEKAVSLVAYHRACCLRQILGSLAHVKGRCSCYVAGSTCTDPPETTLRQAAEAVVEYMERA